MQPNRRLAAMLARYQARLGWARLPGPVLGVHVRRGDACAVWRRGKMHHAGTLYRGCGGVFVLYCVAGGGIVVLYCIITLYYITLLNNIILYHIIILLGLIGLGKDPSDTAVCV